MESLFALLICEKLAGVDGQEDSKIVFIFGEGLIAPDSDAGEAIAKVQACS